MVYTQNSVARGEMVLKQSIRVNTWLRSAGTSDYLLLHNTQILFLGTGGHQYTYSIPEYLIPAPTILATHVLPPAQETHDYDTSESNRKMEAVSVFFGTFRIQCSMRISTATTIATYLSTAKETFLTIYDGEISNPEIPNMGSVHAPMIYVRLAVMSFAPRSNA